MAIDNLDAIGQSLGLESGKLAEMISSEESHTLDLEGVVISKKDDYDSLLNNTKRNSYEVGRKELLKEISPEFEGTGAHKDIQRSIDFLKQWNKKQVDSALEEAIAEPNKQYETLKSDFERMQGISQDWENKYTNLEQTYKQKEQARQIDGALLGAIPDNTTIPKQDVLAILKARTEFGLGDNGVQVLKNGEVLKNDATLNPLSVGEFMSDFIKPYLKPVEGGKGGGDSSKGANGDSYEAFINRMEANDIPVGSSKFNQEMSKAISNGTLKM